MKIKWLGHASFLIASDAGIRIITDPYQTGNGVNYNEINESADIVTTSHQHGDHNYVDAVSGNPEVVSIAVKGRIKDIEFNSLPTYHDDAGGESRGDNIIFCFNVDEMKVCHLGDLGHELDDNQVVELGQVDILLVPVGGFFTIDAATASRVCDKLKPKVVIPMHYKNEKLDYPIGGVDEFLTGKKDVERLDASEVELKKNELPESTQIIVLKPAR